MTGSDGKSDAFVVRGQVQEQETGRPLPDLIVRAYDRDWINDDKVGADTTNRDGEFEIRFALEDFQDFVETRPDLYLRVYDRGGVRLLFETTDAVRRNAGHDERFDLQIPARELDPRRQPS